MPTVKILSCIPRQLNDTEGKLAWLEQTAAEHRPDIFVTPQEYFGGAVMMPHKKAFTLEELFPPLSDLCQKYDMAMAVGLVEDLADHWKEVIWFIDTDGVLKGSIAKIALPRYDHICTKGFGCIEPETDLETRFKTFSLKGVECSAIFCWEAFSNILWTGISLAKPDVVFSMIKFGVNSWPQCDKSSGENVVTGFGYGSWKQGEEDPWLERLQVANLWQVKCPIICSTNSWNLRPVSLPLCGMISKLDGQATESLWKPDRSMKEIPEKIIVDELNTDRVQAALQNKFIYKDLVGEFPPYSLARFTMALKINRLEDRIRSGREQKAVEVARPRKGGFDL